MSHFLDAVSPEFLSDGSGATAFFEARSFHNGHADDPRPCDGFRGQHLPYLRYRHGHTAHDVRRLEDMDRQPRTADDRHSPVHGLL